MSGPENRFIQAVHGYIPNHLVYRMKNHNEYVGGIADCWYSAKCDLWIEWKFIAVPVKNDTLIDLIGGKKPPFTALQQEWLKRRYEEGRNVWLGIGSKDGGVLLRSPEEWSKPLRSIDFRALLKTRRQLADEIMDFTLCR